MHWLVWQTEKQIGPTLEMATVHIRLDGIPSGNKYNCQNKSVGPFSVWKHQRKFAVSVYAWYNWEYIRHQKTRYNSSFKILYGSKSKNQFGRVQKISKMFCFMFCVGLHWLDPFSFRGSQSLGRWNMRWNKSTTALPSFPEFNLTSSSTIPR